MLAVVEATHDALVAAIAVAAITSAASVIVGRQTLRQQREGDTHANDRHTRLEDSIGEMDRKLDRLERRVMRLEDGEAEE